MKKFLFASATVLLVLMLTVFSVVAADAATVTVSADATTAARGDTVTVTVTLSDCVDLKSGGIEMFYDSDVLEVVSGTLSYAQAGSAMVFGEFDPAENVAVFTCTGMNNTPKAANFNGDLLTVTFKVKDTAAYGTTEIDCVMKPVDANGQGVSCVTTQVATLTVACPHTNIIPKNEIPSTCKDQGYAAGIYCNDCETYTIGGERLPEVAHTYEGENNGWEYNGPDFHKRECTVCHDIEQELHRYSDWHPNLEGGYHNKICADCKDGVSGNHTFDTQIATDEYMATGASCTEQATYYYSCSDCGLAGDKTFSYGELLPHTCDREVEDARYKVSDADCLNGSVYYMSCVCGEVGTETFMADDKLGHNFAKAYSFDDDLHYYECLRDGCDVRDGEEPHHGGTASCTVQATCDGCGQSYGELLPHTHDQKVEDAQYKVSDADCLNGSVYYMSCVCGEVGTETFMAADKLGHDFATTYSHDADHHYYVCQRVDCDARDGEKPHQGGTASCTVQAVCDDCGQSYGELLPHTHDQKVEDAQYKVSDADCLNGSVYYMSCVCGEVGTETFMADDKLGHDFATTYSHDADHHYYVCQRVDCDARDGEKPHQGGTASCTVQAVCDDCGQFYGELLKHTYDQCKADTAYLVSAADCTKAAVYYKSCVCGLAGTATFTDGTSLGHTGGTASCTEKAICTRCDKPYGTLLEHVYDQENAQDAYLKSQANCTDAATYYHSCVCGKIGKTTFTVGTELGHAFATEYSTNRTYHYYPCTRIGCGEVKDRQQHTGGTPSCSEQAKCDVCNRSYGSVLEHDYEDEWYEYDENEHMRQCLDCDEWEYEPHAWDDGLVTKPATEEEDGKKLLTCYDCGATKTVDIPALTHTHVFGDGWKWSDTQHWHECACAEKADAADHVWIEEITTPATCEQKGAKTLTCTVCGAVKTEEIPMITEHTWTEEITTPATCAQKGVKTLTCTVCDTIKTEDIPMADHTWNEGEVTTEATEESAGVKTYTCTACGDTSRTEEIPVLEHTHKVTEGEWKSDDTQHWHECSCGEHSDVADHAWTEEITTPATCEQKGVKTLTCTVCGTTKTEDIAMIDHTWNEGKVTTEATEQATGVKTYTCTSCGKATKTEDIPQLEPGGVDDGSGHRCIPSLWVFLLIILFCLLLILLVFILFMRKNDRYR